jgi:Zn-dependent metalloprotease
MNENGLRTFDFNAEDEASGEVLDVLRAERLASPTFFTTEVVGLANLDPETAAQQHLQEVLASEAIPQFSAPEVNSVPSEFKSLGTETLPLTGTTTVKFRQTYNGIPVYGSLITVEMDDENELLAVNSSLGEPANVDPVARISPADVLNTVRTLAGHGMQLPQATPHLYYYFDAAADRWRLVYVVEDISKMDEETTQEAAEHIPFLVDYVIDAHTGDLVAELPRTPSITSGSEEEAKDALGKVRPIRCRINDDGTKSLQNDQLNVHTYDFEFQDLARNASRLPGKIVVNPPDPWNPGTISAHANAMVVARFLRDVLRRNGIDNLGGPLVSSVNCILSSASPDGKQWRNAAWTGDKQMVYGQRIVNGELRSYAAGLDVVAHEMTHGVTSRTARLQYLAQSGALNESYSDIFGIIISNFENADLSSWNWEMGEDLSGTGIPLRDLSEPTKFRQPAHMRDYRILPPTQAGDWGGVHVNSGIHNLAAHKIMTAKDTQGEYLFDASSSAALFYLALTQRLSRTSLFSDSRRAVVSTALTLFRNDESAVRNAKQQAISEAFDAVGIQ